MRRKQARLVLTFSTTTAAMEMERYCLDHAIAGRLIPTPRQITADCGLAWSAPPEAEEAVLRAAAGGSIVPDAVYHLEL